MDAHYYVLDLRHSGAWVYVGAAVVFLSCCWVFSASTACFNVLVITFRPIFLGYYGYDVYFCWFNCPNPNIQFGLKLGYFFGPLWIFFFLEVYWAYRTYKKLKEVGLEERELNIFKKILLFPIILLITGLFGTIDLIYI